MSDYQQIVDEIRYALQSENCELTEALQQAAQEYSQACREVNQRLRRIETYLDGGLRSEAIQLAEGPPDIEELVEVLNFPEQDEWSDIVAIYDLPRNEPLLLRVIEQLNEAQVVELPLQNLMSRHRLLALHRAPLRMRLAVLRELQFADPETFTWEEDVRDCEKARLQEITQECRSAQKEGNFSLLKQLHEEVTGENWLETPPASLVRMIKGSAAELSRHSALKGLFEVAQGLEQSFQELDLTQARSLASRWKDLLRGAGQSAPAELVSQVAPILGWVQDELTRETAERNYQSLITRLEYLLDQGGSIEELDQTVHQINRLERELPDFLAIRYRNQRDTLQLARSRTHRLQFGSAVAVIAVLTLGVGLLVRNQLAANEVQRLADHVNRLLDDRNLEEAQAALAVRPDALRWDQLAIVQARVTTELKKDVERKLKYAELIEKAQATATFSESIAVLEQAQLIAVSPEEQQQVLSLKREKAKQNNDAMAVREAAFNESVVSARDLLKTIHLQMEADVDSDRVGEMLSEATKIVERLQRSVQGLRPEFNSQLQLISARHQELSELRRSRMTLQHSADELTTRAMISGQDPQPEDAVERYHAALLAFAEALPDSQVAEMYRKSAGELANWQSAILWSKLSGRWSGVWPRDLTVISNRTRECKAYIAEHPGAPDAPMAQRYIEQLESVASITGHVDGSGAGLQTKLLRIFSSALVERSWCLKTKDGRTFYLPKKETIPSTGLPNFKFFVGYAEEDVQIQKRIPPDDLVSLQATASPSQILARWVNDRVAMLPAEEWNAFCLELSSRIMDDQELNDFLKLDLLKRSLDLAASGDVFLKEQLEPHLKLVQGAAISPLARWMNPDDVDGTRATNDSKQVLAHFRRLKDLREVWKDADVERANFHDSLKRPRSMVGWLRMGNQWTCQLDKSRPFEDADLFVMFTKPGANASEWQKIGQVRGGEVLLNPQSSAYLQAGRPVFAYR